MPDPSFVLSKWYLDVIASDGTSFIGYAADLKWKRTAFHYNGYLLADTTGNVTTKSSFAGTSVNRSETELNWRSVLCVGRWKRLEDPIQEDLLVTEAGSIRWECFLPKADAEVVVGNQTIVGLGYAEKIELTVAPWRLPIRQLFWGRYVSALNSILWIEWRGPIPKILIFFNGQRFTTGSIGDHSVSFGDHRVVFDSSLLLRSGSIGSTVFAGLKKFMTLFPGEIFKLDENKWTGRASLMENEHVVDAGSYIREQVNWK